MGDLDLADVQGNILRSYGRHLGFVRHLVLQVAEPARARAALADMVTGDRGSPEITSASQAPRQEAFGWCLNVGFTYTGLQALGLPDSSLRTFPREFREGMVARASWLGDVGQSAPEHWVGGLDDPDRAHLVVTIHGHTVEDIDPIADAVVGAAGGKAFNLASPTPFDGAMFTGPQKGAVHFGFQDGLSNVRFEGVHGPDDHWTKGPRAPLGVVLLGHPTTIPHVRWRVPFPEARLGHNGSFNAFRVLGQDVRGFEAFLQRTAADVGCSPEEVAAKMCGRWRNGAPLSLAPTEAEARALADPLSNQFGYLDDLDGDRCPIGSHIRRCNPRDSTVVQRGTNNHRPLVRRGMPYGPPYDPARADDVPRGLLGSFLCASLGAQFEALQFGWLNLGLQDPRITGTNDPLVGSNEPETARFAWKTAAGEPAEVGDLPNFVRTLGGAYCFLPSCTAVRWIADGGWGDDDGRPVRRRRRLPTSKRHG